MSDSKQQTSFDWKRPSIWLGGSIVVLGLFWWGSSMVGNKNHVSFNEDVRPILNDNCLVCHGGVRQSGEFSLLFESDAYEPNESGKPAIVPGHPDSSEMIARVLHPDPEERMPLDHEPLSGGEVDLLKQWIKEGARWEQHWAYVAPKPLEPPYPKNSTWARNRIDQFILTRLEQEELEPAPEANCSTLHRRLSLDLTGLPPTPAEVDAFCNDTSDEAYEKIVDRLLESRHFGERWAAMWLDLARYADTKGYEKDGSRTIWKFRDWVIHALNRDLPFDEFTIQQIAGDLLPDPAEDQLIATAFHRNTMNNDEGGTDDEEFRTASVIDRVNTTWEVWMGTTMSCVQCHGHPYDPFRQKDYYEFFAFLNNTQDRDTPDEAPTLNTYNDLDKAKLTRILPWIAEAEGTEYPSHETWEEQKAGVLYPRARLYAGENDGYEKLNVVGRRIGSVKDGAYLIHRGINLSGADELSINYASGGDGGYVEVFLDSLEGRRIAHLFLPPTENWSDFTTLRFPIAAVSGTHDLHFSFSKAGEGSLFDIVWFYFHDSISHLSKEKRAELIEKRKEAASIRPEAATPIMREMPAESARKTYVFNRGNWMDPTEEVQPAVPAILPQLPADVPQNRLGLAQWIVSRENPLTSRVIVNRFWAELFGTGIVETLEDFGSQGAAPSHPELLDWLAQEFMTTHEWSVKRLLKYIVSSATYRQRSHVDPATYDRDPGNKLLARGPRIRLTAEQVRDQALAVSGLLSRKMFGPSVMPYQPEGIWNAPYSSEKWTTSEGEDSYRRGIYTYWRRTAPYPSMVAFDSPSREFCVSRRISTNTPLQALVTLNDPVYVEAAQALAARMIEEGGEKLESRIRAGFQRALVRDPQPGEIDVLRTLYKDAYFDYQDQGIFVDASLTENPSGDLELAAFTVVANAILNLDEFITKP